MNRPTLSAPPYLMAEAPIFLATTIPLWLRIEVFLLTGARNPVSSAPEPLPAAA